MHDVTMKANGAPFELNRTRRERVQLMIAVAIIMVLSLYRLLIEIRPSVDSFFSAYTEFPVAVLLLNGVFLWLLLLLWVAYHRWRDSILAEQELKRVLMSISPDSLIVLDRDRKISMCSGQVYAMFGVHEKDLIGQKTDVLYDDRRVYGSKGEITSRLEQFGFQVGYATGKREDGTTFPLEVITGTIRYQQGAVILMRDISEQCRIEDALRHSEMRFEQFMRHFPGFAFIKDADGKRVYLNEAYARECGWDIENCLGRTDADLFRRDLARQYQESDNLVLAQNKVVRYVTRTAEPDGVVRSLLTVKFPLPSPDADQARPMVAGLSLDISEQEAAEREKLKIERQMLQAQKLESLGVMAGGIAHDFNNLLMGMLGHADLALRKTPESSELHKHIDAVVHSCQRATELANQLLAYSGQGRFSLEVVNLSDLVEGLSGLLKVSISKKAALYFDLARDLSPVEGDVTQIRQVIMNLIVNASDSLEDRPGTISIQTGRTRWNAADGGQPGRFPGQLALTPGEYVFVRISDTGIGMSEQTREKIFDPFFTTKQTGHGLGLAAVLGIVRSHRGAIEIDSEEGQGSRFAVYLPTTDKALVEGTEEKVCDENWMGSGTVLLADDEEMVREVGRMMLETLGFDVVCVANGREAVLAAEEQHETLRAVVLDMTMPELDGVDACHLMRARYADIPIILSSGYNQREDMELPGAGKQVYFLKKPYRLDRLRTIMRTVTTADAGDAGDAAQR